MEIGTYPTSDNTCAIWRTTYSVDGNVLSIKDYRLCRGLGDDDLILDEGNGIKLKSKWIGDVLVIPFKYDDLFLISTTRLRQDILEDEILMVDDKPAIKGPLSLDTRAVQRIQLKRFKT